MKKDDGDDDDDDDDDDVKKLHCVAKKLHNFIFAITLSKRFIVKKSIGTYPPIG